MSLGLSKTELAEISLQAEEYHCYLRNKSNQNHFWVSFLPNFSLTISAKICYRKNQNTTRSKKCAESKIKSRNLPAAKDDFTKTKSYIKPNKQIGAIIFLAYKRSKVKLVIPIIQKIKSVMLISFQIILIIIFQPKLLPDGVRPNVLHRPLFLFSLD